MGEQIEPITMTEEQFINSVLKLTGMNEHSGKLVKPFKSEELYMIANCTNVTGSEVRLYLRSFFKNILHTILY